MIEVGLGLGLVMDSWRQCIAQPEWEASEGCNIEDTATDIFLIYASLDGVYCSIDDGGITFDIPSQKDGIPILIYVGHGKHGSEDLIWSYPEVLLQCYVPKP